MKWHPNFTFLTPKRAGWPSLIFLRNESLKSLHPTAINFVNELNKYETGSPFSEHQSLFWTSKSEANQKAIHNFVWFILSRNSWRQQTVANSVPDYTRELATLLRFVTTRRLTTLTTKFVEPTAVDRLVYKHTLALHTSLAWQCIHRLHFIQPGLSLFMRKTSTAHWPKHRQAN